MRVSHAPAAVLMSLFVVGMSAGQTRNPDVSRPFEVVETTIDEVQSSLREGRVTCRALVEAYLARIRTYDKNGPALNAVQTINPRALEQADRLDATFKASGPVGRLHCVPVLVKDQIDTMDMPTSHGFIGFKDFVPAADATIVTRLKTAGALIIGKTTMGELASGYISSASGPIRNAYDPRRSASGSSGGTGSGVAASFATVGIGEDTGGSVRGPAAVNALVGLRPTLPLVSRHGMSPARPSTDTIGPMTRTVRDAAILFDTMVGYDQKDPVTAQGVRQTPESYTSSLRVDGLRGARVGVIREPMNSNTNPQTSDYRLIRGVVDRAVARMRELGADIVDNVTIPDVIDRLNRAYDANVFETERAIDEYLRSHHNAPYKSLREILLSGRVVPARARTLMDTIGKSPDDPAYAQVLHAQEDLRHEVFALMADRQLDVLLYATFDHLPGVIAEDVMTRTTVPDAAGLGSNRRLSPVLGFPALAVPGGFIEGVPVGIEFMARPFGEPDLFRLAYAFEQGTRHRTSPPLTPALDHHP
jgi:amidase